MIGVINYIQILYLLGNIFYYVIVSKMFYEIESQDQKECSQEFLLCGVHFLEKVNLLLQNQKE
jgi:hypothetical protein